MTGEVETEGGASFLHCSVNGVKSRPKLVILDDTVHLFSKVGPLPQPGWRRAFGSAPPDWLPAGSPHPPPLLFVQEGSAQVSVPVPKYLAGVSGSGAQGGAVAPMTGTIEKVGWTSRTVCLKHTVETTQRENCLFIKRWRSSQKVRGPPHNFERSRSALSCIKSSIAL